jgi:hypothetical protein
VTDNDAALEPQFRDVTQAELKAEIPANHVRLMIDAGKRWPWYDDFVFFIASP